MTWDGRHRRVLMKADQISQDPGTLPQKPLDAGTEGDGCTDLPSVEPCSRLQATDQSERSGCAVALQPALRTRSPEPQPSIPQILAKSPPSPVQESTVAPSKFLGRRACLSGLNSRLPSSRRFPFLHGFLSFLPRLS